MIRLSGRFGCAGAILILGAGLVHAADDDDRERSKIASAIDQMAGSVYKLAWPTATYKSWSFADFRRVPGGFDVIVKFSGLSAFDGSDLWLKLDFALRSNGIDDVRVDSHNAIISPPFATSRALGQIGMEIARELAQPGPKAPPPTESTPVPPPSYVPPPAYVSPPVTPPPPTPFVPTRGGAVCIDNPTDTPVSFRYRWGTAPWHSINLNPQMTQPISWPYDSPSQAGSPSLDIEFDDNFAHGYTPRRYSLIRNQSELPVNCETAKRYRFVIAGQYIDLRAIN